MSERDVDQSDGHAKGSDTDEAEVGQPLDEVEEAAEFEEDTDGSPEDADQQEIEPDASDGEGVDDPGETQDEHLEAEESDSEHLEASTNETAEEARDQEHPSDDSDEISDPDQGESEDSEVPSSGVTEDEAAQEDGLVHDEPQSAAPAPAIAPQTRELHVPDGPLARLRGWFGGKSPQRQSSTRTPPEQGSEQIEAAESPDDPSLGKDAGVLEQEARDELGAFEESEKQWAEYVASAEDSARALKERIEAKESQLADLNKWVSQYDRSYQWKVQQRMDQQLAKAEADLRAYEHSARNVEDFEPGRLIDLRKQFHRLIARPTLVAFLLSALSLALPILFQIPKLDALETFYNPQLSAPIIFLVVTAVIIVVLLVRRAFGGERIKNSTILRWILLAVFVGLLLLVMPGLEQPFRENVIPFIEEYQWLIQTVIWLTIIVWILIALTIYYQGWSQYRRGVDNQLAKLRAVIAGYVATQQEVNRLRLLYHQTADWLEILAHALYRPWAIDPEWQNKRQLETEIEEFPFSLRVAQVDDQAGSKSAELERVISRRLLVQGWRADAFTDLVSEVAEDLGIGQDNLNVDALDRDLPHQTNNTRNVFRDYLDRSTVADGESVNDHSERNPHLIEVARTRLNMLIQQTQSVALSAARPSVTQMIQDPLEDVDFEYGSSPQLNESQDWDSFLKESLGTDEIIKPPLSILGLSSAGQMNKAGENPRTFVIIPQRLHGALPSEASDSSHIEPVSDDTARPVEIIARIDVSKPLQQSALRLFSGSEGRNSQSKTQTAGSNGADGSVCSQCFDPTCPAGNDRSASCINTTI